MSDAQTSFERLRAMAAAVPLPESEDLRDVRWCGERQIIGFARHPAGAYELFLAGEQLRPGAPLVRRHLRFDRWARVRGEDFRANRLVFPADEHFLSVVAFLAEELLRNGVEQSLQQGFARAEPLVEMALRRVALGEDVILGLMGELRFLRALLSVAPTPDRKGLVLDAWRGHEHRARDFVFGSRSVEVKATRGDRSVHRINSVFQVDPSRNEAGEPAEDLALLSFGFLPATDDVVPEAALTLPGEVDSVLASLGDQLEAGQRNPAQKLFLSKVAEYGGDPTHSYVHDEMKDWSAYRVPWLHGFVRVYDMSDPAVLVLRRDDLRRRSYVRLESVSFEIELPDRITGDRNPQTDLFGLARSLIGLGGGIA